MSFINTIFGNINQSNCIIRRIKLVTFLFFLFSDFLLILIVLDMGCSQLINVIAEYRRNDSNLKDELTIDKHQVVCQLDTRHLLIRSSMRVFVQSYYRFLTVTIFRLVTDDESITRVNRPRLDGS